MPYVAVKIDVVRSRKVRNRQELQDLLFRAVDAANDRFRKAIAARFTVTHGDEIQGLLHPSASDHLVPLCEHFVDAVAPQRIRFGVGVGGLATELQPLAIGMDGEAWYRANEAVERARRQRKAFVLEAGPQRHELTRQVTAVVDFLLTHRALWSENQREAVQLLEKLGTQQRVAEQLGISTAAVSKRLAACLWDQYAALRDVAVAWVMRAVGSVG
ncbi:MAG: hypothetical protein GX161_04710 [Firmicutes bacterium]|jgi:hypothetical protein|nr:hypothetical protein [Bacillota bacterium]